MAKKKFKCNICGGNYVSKRGLHIHMSQKHPDKKKIGKEEKKGPIGEALDIKLVKNPWKIFSFVLIILLALTLVSLTGPAKKGGELTEQEAGEKVIDFVNKNLVRTGSATLVGVNETDSGMYRVMTSYQGKQVPLYVTKDGSQMFMQSVSLGETEQTDESSQQNQQTEDILKSDKPKVELFVMSFCPYGNQAENTMYPVYKSLKNQVDWNIHFIVSGSKGNFKSLHGQEEVDQNMRELCVLNESDMDKWWEFATYVNKNCGSKGLCWEEAARNAGLDVNKIKTCVDEKGANLLAKEVKATQESGATGSPTLFINGKKSKTVYDYGDSDSYKQTICSAFIEAPSECEQVLGSGGSSNPSSSVSAQC